MFPRFEQLFRMKGQGRGEQEELLEKNGMRFLKNKIHIIQQSHFWVYRQGNKTEYQGDTCPLIAALFTLAKIKTQPKCPSMDEWMNTHTPHPRTHTHVGVLQGNHEKEGNPAISNNGWNLKVFC